MTVKSPITAPDQLAAARKAKAEKIASGDWQILNPIQRAHENPGSLRMAINAMCYHCQGGLENTPPDPGWKWAIGNCTVDLCPLHPHRAYQNKEGTPPEGVYR